MRLIPRIALGAVGESSDSRPLLAALLTALRGQGLETQVFHARASYFDDALLCSASGRLPRHLDTWLMSPDYCRRAFAEGAGACELAIVCDDPDTHVFAGTASPGGSFSQLCDWLELARLGVLDARVVALGHLPERPQRIGGLFLDSVASPQQFHELKTLLEANWRVPVLGYVPELPALRAELLSTSAETLPSHELLERWSHSLVLEGGWRALHELLRGQTEPGGTPSRIPQCTPLPRHARAPLQVAVAYDEAFHHYFADALDTLEARGAMLRTFSPLHDEHLPEGVDIVLLGGGSLEPYAARLASNHCLLQSLRRYIAEGGYVYGEGGGLAYLCENVEISPGCNWSMVGALPATARLRRHPQPAAPQELHSSSTSWLARRGTLLRGYLDGRWEFDHHGPLYRIAGHSADLPLLAGRHNVVGSRLHLHFAALPGLLENLLSVATRRLASAEL